MFELFEQDREAYDFAGAFVEGADWVVWYLTGVEKRSSCPAGYKAMWSADTGLPDARFFQTVNPFFTHPAEKLGTRFFPLGTQASGHLLPEVARSLRLFYVVAVAVGNVDAPVSVPGVGVSSPGTLVMVAAAAPGASAAALPSGVLLEVAR